MHMCLYTSVLLLQGDTKRDSGTNVYFFILLFGSSALPEVAVIGSIVSVDHGIALTQLVVITGFPVDLIGRLVAFPDPLLGFSSPSLLRGYKGVGIPPVDEGTDFVGLHALVRFIAQGCHSQCSQDGQREQALHGVGVSRVSLPLCLAQQQRGELYFQPDKIIQLYIWLHMKSYVFAGGLDYKIHFQLLMCISNNLLCL